MFVENVNAGSCFVGYFFLTAVSDVTLILSFLNFVCDVDEPSFLIELFKNSVEWVVVRESIFGYCV